MGFVVGGEKPYIQAYIHAYMHTLIPTHTHTNIDM